MKPTQDRPRIMMVDDDADFLSIVQGWLSKRYETFPLLNGEGLLEELEGMRPDLLVLDVRMRGPDDGFRICRSVRADPRFQDLPVLFLTGCKSDEDFIRNMNAGGTAYLTKPVERRELLSTVQNLIAADYVQ